MTIDTNIMQTYLHASVVCTYIYAHIFCYLNVFTYINTYIKASKDVTRHKVKTNILDDLPKTHRYIVSYSMSEAKFNIYVYYPIQG